MVGARRHQKEHHNSPHSVVIHTEQHRGRLPQQTQTAEVGLQTDLIKRPDTVTELFLPVPLILLALEEVLEQQIMVILICLG